jgi:hypothetical protein
MNLKRPAESWSDYCRTLLIEVDDIVFAGDPAVIITDETNIPPSLNSVGHMPDEGGTLHPCYTLFSRAIERKGKKYLTELRSFVQVCEEFAFGACYLVRLRARKNDPTLALVDITWAKVQGLPPEVMKKVLARETRGHADPHNKFFAWYVDAWIVGRIAAHYYNTLQYSESAWRIRRLVRNNEISPL